MLKLRRAIVIDAGPPEDGPEQRMTVELAGAAREAIADVGLVGRAQAGDEVIVNVEALDLGLGSGGFDIVHVNLTRGLGGAGGRPGGGEDGTSHGSTGAGTATVMKLNYTSLQHAVRPVEEAGAPAAAARAQGRAQGARLTGLPLGRPVGVLALHGQLGAVAWAFAQQVPQARLGYVQTEGGALPGGHSRAVRELLGRGLLVGHLTAGAAFGGEGEAISVAGALRHGLGAMGWDAAVCGPGPGIVGSGSSFGHGGMVALDSAHVAVALGCPTVLVARMSSADRRERHRCISHHTLTVLELLIEPVTIALPADGAGEGSLALERSARIARHDWRSAHVDLPGYAASGLPAEHMGRGIAADPLFFGAALAGGAVLAQVASELE